MSKHINILFTSGHTLELEDVVDIESMDGVTKFIHKSGNISLINGNNVNFIRVIEEDSDEVNSDV